MGSMSNAIFLGGPKPGMSWCGSQVRTMGIGLKSAIVSASAKQPAFMSHLAPGNMAVGWIAPSKRGEKHGKFLWKSNLFVGHTGFFRTWTKRESNWNQLGMNLEWHGRGHDVRNHVRYVCWWEADGNAKISFNSGIKMHGACIGNQHPEFALPKQTLQSGKHRKVLYWPLLHWNNRTLHQ